MAKPGKSVRLSDVVEGFLDGSGEWMHYVDRETGDVVVVTDSLGASEIFDIPEDQHLEDAYPGRFVLIPGPGEQYELRAMRSFAGEHDDEDTRRRLRDATYGRGLYRRFKDEVYRLGLRDQWFEYRLRHAAPDARRWLFEQHIVFRDDIDPPSGRDD